MGHDKKPTVPDGSNGRGREVNGRFGSGNRFGKGNPRLTQYFKLRAAIDRAVTPTRLKKIVSKLADLAENGDTNAAKIILDRCLGRVPVATTESATVTLPKLTDAASCVEAMNIIFAALGQGGVSIEEARDLAALVEQARKSVETLDIASRLADLEAHHLGERIR
jgi:hypothetical protein